MHIVKDSLLVIGRIYTIYPLLLAVSLYMGRRSIGQLPVFDFLIFLSLGSVVGADIADPKVQHIHTAVAIIAIGIMQKLFSYFVIRSRKFGKWTTFEPVIVLKDGMFMQRNLKKVKYSIDDILQMLREKNIFDPAFIHLAILEGNGQLSVLPRSERQQATMQDLGLNSAAVGIAYPVIREGVAQSITLQALNESEEALLAKLSRKGVALKDVFFASMDENGELNITVYGAEPAVPPVYH